MAPRLAHRVRSSYRFFSVIFTVLASFLKAINQSISQSSKEAEKENGASLAGSIGHQTENRYTAVSQNFLPSLTTATAMHARPRQCTPPEPQPLTPLVPSPPLSSPHSLTPRDTPPPLCDSLVSLFCKAPPGQGRRRCSTSSAGARPSRPAGRRAKSSWTACWGREAGQAAPT